MRYCRRDAESSIKADEKSKENPIWHIRGDFRFDRFRHFSIICQFICFGETVRPLVWKRCVLRGVGTREYAWRGVHNKLYNTCFSLQLILSHMRVRKGEGFSIPLCNATTQVCVKPTIAVIRINVECAFRFNPRAIN